MDMNSSYFTAVSGDRIGIWSTESLKDALQMDASSIQALWATKLNGRGKATSIKISESILALSSWDGSAFVYKRVSTSEWNRVGTDSSSLDSCWEQSALQSENEYAPTTIVLGSDTFAVSAPNSTEIRIYDMNKNSLIQTVTFGSGKEVQGMVSLRFTDSLQNERYLIAAVNDLDKMVIFTTK
jgi:WD40 repeat protein